MIPAKEAHAKASNYLVQCVQLKWHEEFDWLATAIQVLWERAVQEGVAQELDAFNPSQAISLANGYTPTRKRVMEMKDNPAEYGSIYKASVVSGPGAYHCGVPVDDLPLTEEENDAIINGRGGY